MSYKINKFEDKYYVYIVDNFKAVLPNNQIDYGSTIHCLSNISIHLISFIQK